jgi:hypothetical protein
MLRRWADLLLPSLLLLALAAVQRPIRICSPKRGPRSSIPISG